MEKRLLIFAGLVLLGMCGSVIAAPTVSSVSGTINEGSTITITGSGFGATGPNIILFDDFEKGTNGQAIRTGTGSAEIGMWSSIEGEKIPRYSNAAKVSGTLAFRADMSVYWRELIETPLPQNTREIFLSWWIYLPAGTNIPGEGTADQTNWKNVWIQGAGTVDDDITLPTFLPGSYAITGNDGLYTKWIDLDFRKGSWKHLWSWISVDDGLLDYWELTDSGVVQRDNAKGVAILKSGGAFERVDINGYGRETPNCFPMFDDIYIASNPARIEIGNKPTYETSTMLTIFTAASWSGSQVQSTARLGQFKSGEQAYLYIFDSANSHNAAGYPVTIGSGSSSSVCGNGIKEGTEQCEDGNTVTESCAYGQTICTVCSSTCQNVTGVTAYCGDAKCNSGETCTSCASDCGTCTCNPDWICSAWSACASGQQTRTCTDSNSCGTTTGKPVLSQPCGSDEMIVDNRDPSVSKQGAWESSSFYPGYYGTDYEISYSPTDWFEWTATVQPGTYGVYAWWQAIDGRPAAAKYSITHASGTAESTVDQQVNGGKWNLLGTYSFGSIAKFRLSAQSPGGQGICADAIKLVKSTHAADTDKNGCITMAELSVYMNQWKSGTSIQLSDLMEAIRLWKQGC